MVSPLIKVRTTFPGLSRVYWLKEHGPSLLTLITELQGYPVSSVHAQGVAKRLTPMLPPAEFSDDGFLL